VNRHAFISYVREDANRVDWLQRKLESAGVRVWRDTADLWPGEDWRAKIRQAIQADALVFIACFSQLSIARSRSYQNEELVLAIEEYRLRSPDIPWLIPVRFDKCDIPDRDIGGGRTLNRLQRVDLFGDRADESAIRLIASVLRILGRTANISGTATPSPRASASVPSPTKDQAASTSGATAWHRTLGGRRAARDREARFKREEVMRNLRWAAELAVSDDAAKMRLGVRELDALRNSKMLGPDAEEIIYAALRAAIEIPVQRIEQSGLEADAVVIKTADDDLGLPGVQGAYDQPRQHAGSSSSLKHWIPEQSTSHTRLLDYSRQPSGRAKFGAILVPTNRPAGMLRDCLSLAVETAVPLIVICSKRTNTRQVIDAAAQENVEVFAVDLPPPPANPLESISFATSTDKDLLAVTWGLTRDLSTKRNLGMVIARMLGWQRLMFLNDDIYDVSKEDVLALATGLDDHNVSVLISDMFPDNSVVCHAHRLGGGQQGTFASAGAMGVRCDRDDLAFFPNIYNDDWFFFSEEAADHKIAWVGTSRQREYDPYEDPQRAVNEEFGDLMAEGLYARLDANLDILGVDVAYWAEFIERRRDFLEQVAESLARHPNGDLDIEEGQKLHAAQVSIRAAQSQLKRISPGLCQKFIELWQADQVEWQSYLTKLPHFDSVGSALDHLGLDYAVFPPK
jgi:hypothetical protein